MKRYKLDLFNPEILLFTNELDEAVKELEKDADYSSLAKELADCDHLQGVRLFGVNKENGKSVIIIWVMPMESEKKRHTTLIHECVHAAISLFSHHGQDIEKGEEIFAMTVEKLYDMMRVEI